jgi:hypothetical protein
MMNEKRSIPNWARLLISLLIAHLPLIPPVIGFLVLHGKTKGDELHGIEVLCAKLAPAWNLVFLCFYLPSNLITGLLLDPHSWTPAIIGCSVQSTLIGIGIWALWRKRSMANPTSESAWFPASEK